MDLVSLPLGFGYPKQRLGRRRLVQLRSPRNCGILYAQEATGQTALPAQQSGA
jgi:hypothetical protein